MSRILGVPRQISSYPEINLWAAVLMQAIHDLNIPEERNKAFAWIKDSQMHLGSFMFVCDALNLSPSAVRTRIYKKYTNTSPQSTTQDTLKTVSWNCTTCIHKYKHNHLRCVNKDFLDSYEKTYGPLGLKCDKVKYDCSGFWYIAQKPGENIDSQRLPRMLAENTSKCIHSIKHNTIRCIHPKVFEKFNCGKLGEMCAKVRQPFWNMCVDKSLYEEKCLDDTKCGECKYSFQHNSLRCLHPNVFDKDVVKKHYFRYGGWTSKIIETCKGNWFEKK